MTLEQTRYLYDGLYRIYWYSDPGRLSVAAVGRDSSGAVWYAPTNWISGIPCFDWASVERV